MCPSGRIPGRWGISYCRTDNEVYGKWEVRRGEETVPGSEWGGRTKTERTGGHRGFSDLVDATGVGRGCATGGRPGARPLWEGPQGSGCRGVKAEGGTAGVSPSRMPGLSRTSMPSKASLSQTSLGATGFTPKRAGSSRPYSSEKRARGVASPREGRR